VLLRARVPLQGPQGQRSAFTAQADAHERAWRLQNLSSLQRSISTCTRNANLRLRPRRMLAIQSMGAVRSFCFHRLLLLEQKFNLHVMMNADKEFLAQKSAPHRDFYNVRKVRRRSTASLSKPHNLDSRPSSFQNADYIKSSACAAGSAVHLLLDRSSWRIRKSLLKE